jgi:hypothetical protein
MDTTMALSNLQDLLRAASKGVFLKHIKEYIDGKIRYSYWAG